MLNTSINIQYSGRDLNPGHSRTPSLRYVYLNQGIYPLLFSWLMHKHSPRKNPFPKVFCVSKKGSERAVSLAELDYRSILSVFQVFFINLLIKSMCIARISPASEQNSSLDCTWCFIKRCFEWNTRADYAHTIKMGKPPSTPSPKNLWPVLLPTKMIKFFPTYFLKRIFVH